MKDRARKFQGVSTWRARAAIHAVALLAGAAALGGCSLTVPMGGAVTDDAPTGSIKPVAAHPSPFSSQMDAEDWRRAKSALDTALDPQGNGKTVTWENPASGAKGSFLPLAQVYPKGDGICRPFSANVAVKGEAETVLHSSACRVNSGEWVVGKVIAGKASMPKKSDNLAERDTGTQLR